MTQKEYNVYELKLSMDKVQSHCTYYICKDSASYLPSLTTNPVTEGWVQFHYVHPASKSSDLTEGKEEKGPMQRGLKTPWWQRIEEEQILRLMQSIWQIILPRDWQKCFSPTLKTYLAMGLQSMWLWTLSCGQVGDGCCQLREGCGKSCIATSPLFRVSTPQCSISTYPNYSLSHCSCFTALCIEET